MTLLQLQALNWW